ncbi:MAG: hypothetical protein ACFHX7_12455 [Pseudomonadota bacterium]
MNKTLGSDWVVNHVGMTIANRNATLRHYQALGVGVSVGPQPLLPHEEGEGSLMFWRTLEGDPVTNTYRTGGAHNFVDGECQIGNCQLECYPMKPGPGMFLNEYLAKKGPGINHICFNTPDVEEDTRFLVGKGCEVMFNATVNGRTVENYLDSRQHGDVMISLRPPATDWENAWKANNEAHPLVNDWRFVGVGIGVSDLSAAVDYYGHLGFDTEGGTVADEQLGMGRQRVRVGPLLFELCEPLAETSLCADSIQQRGDGVFDLVFAVPDLDTERRRLAGRNLPVYREGEDSLVFDTRAEGNILLRLTAE